ncbi:hypothetical protein [uncultured Roseobacter sp.]|uniref:hypothetical protein n=1 Tax=uncultured Roseobacter sp. TaxID=114847 RepID=UPI0026285EB8|nr:hypothetical protein [uncultured Roseobacter sp.]
MPNRTTPLREGMTAGTLILIVNAQRAFAEEEHETPKTDRPQNMTEVILHIGTPKTGTTAIQHAMSINEEVLAQENIAFIKTGRHRAAHNDLANAITRHGADHKFQDAFAAEFAKAAVGGGKILLSSEIFSLIPPSKFRRSLPPLDAVPMKIVVYLRRQDQYAEAFYKQRLKNGRITIPFDEFLESRVCQRITNYQKLLNGWSETYPQAQITPRIYDRAGFVNQDIVADFAAILGLRATDLDSAQVEHNVSPSRDVIDILLALAPHFEAAELRKIFRTAKALDLNGFSGQGDLFTSEERQTFCARFATDDAALRQRFFPDRETLFPAPRQTSPDQQATDRSDTRPALLKAMLQIAFDLKRNQD